MKAKKLWWFGPRQSDIKDVNGNLFEGSVTLLGNIINEYNEVFCQSGISRFNHNITKDEQNNFTIKNALNVINKGGTCMFYNPNMVYRIPKIEELYRQGKIICVNNIDIMQKMNNKIEFRKFISCVVPTVESLVINPKNFTFKELRERFNHDKKFVVQAPVACGGYGTFLMDELNEKSIINTLNESSNYIVSRFFEKSIPINIHAIIYDSEILLISPSIQIIRNVKNRLIYRGADFIAYDEIPSIYKEKFKKYVLKVCKKMQTEGYRGVCGIDALAYSNEVFTLEVNNRFQASTPLINLALKSLKMKSLQELNIDAFEHKYPSALDLKTSEIKVNFSSYTYLHFETQIGNTHAKTINGMKENLRHIVDVIDDGYFTQVPQCENDAYLCKVVFDTNITSITPDNCVTVNENVAEHDEETYHLIKNKDTITVKLALLNQGVCIDETAKDWFKNNSDFLRGTNDAIDLFFDEELSNLVVNVPVSNKFVELSPFKLTYNNGFEIHYYNSYWKKVKINLADENAKKRSSNGVLFKDICCFATDRLRIHHTNSCIFKLLGKGCKFCNIPAHSGLLNINDIKEAIIFYNSIPEIKHFLVGGQSAHADEEYPLVIETIKAIREIDNEKPIYVMVLPPKDLNVINLIYEAGATQIAFAIEIFDSIIAKEIMPEKGATPREKYFDALIYATKLFGNNGEVRSLLIAGLEPMESFLDGVEQLAKNRIQPIISVFRPLSGTPLENYTHPSMKYLKEIREKAVEICKKYNMRLGPDCIDCQNNTLN